MIQLVDPVSRLRIDIFPDLSGSLNTARPVAFAGETVLALNCDAILNHKLAILSKASEGTAIDEKHYQDALALAALCRRAVPPRYPGRDAYCTDVSARCLRCKVSWDSAFTLAPKQEIFDLLAYV